MRIASLLLALLLCSGAGAQLTLKPKAGATLSRFGRAEKAYPFYWDDRYLAGWQAGVAASYAWRHVSVQAELLYNTKGNKVDYSTPQSSSWTGYRFHYIELPVLVHYRLFRGIHAGIGGYYAQLLKGQFLADGAVQQEGLRRYTTSDYGLLGELVFRSRHLEVGGRYSWGLRMQQFQVIVPANDPEFDPEPYKDLGRNRGFQLYVAVPVRL